MPTAEKKKRKEKSNADFTGTKDPMEVRRNFIAIYWKIVEWYHTARSIVLLGVPRVINLPCQLDRVKKHGAGRLTGW